MKIGIQKAFKSDGYRISPVIRIKDVTGCVLKRLPGRFCVKNKHIEKYLHFWHNIYEVLPIHYLEISKIAPTLKQLVIGGKSEERLAYQR